MLEALVIAGLVAAPLGSAALFLPGRHRYRPGPLAAFAGTFRGRGLNTIFRPNSTQTPTPLPTRPEGRTTTCSRST